MEPRLIALKLVLKTLHVSDDISTVDDRKRVQKAIYLGQVAGVDLGYRFGWYLMGPYSTALARDYYEMAKSADAPPDDASRHLAPRVEKTLSDLSPLFNVPTEAQLQQEQWLELLASVHYLRTVRGMNPAEATAALESEKRDVAPYTQLAATLLSRYRLLRDAVREASC